MNNISEAERRGLELEARIDSLKRKLEQDMQQPLIDIERERDELKLKVGTNYSFHPVILPTNDLNGYTDKQCRPGDKNCTGPLVIMSEI